MSDPLVRVRDVTVRYGATTALADVTLDFQAGEIHALVGENGAGKSTLLHVLAGARRADAGRIQLARGVRVTWVPQEPDLPPDLTVVEAIFLGAELCGPAGWLRHRAMDDAARELLASMGAQIDVRTRVGSLTAPQRKQVQIAHALRHDPDLLLLDEPTAVLGAHDSERLFTILAQRRALGCAIVYVSHRLEEVMRVADRVTVLRDGQHISTDPASTVSVADLVSRMVGREVAAATRRRTPTTEEVLRLTGVRAGLAHGVSLAVRAGEIVGLAGLVGAGRSDVLEAIVGLQPHDGTIVCAEAAMLLPEDRGRNGVVAPFSLRENLFLPPSSVWLDRRQEQREGAQWIERLRIRAGDVDAPITALSGGNQQKVLLARVLRHQPRLLLLDEPTAGVDVGAKAEIHGEIARLAKSGIAVLLASSELAELLALCDRICAMRAGRIVAELAAADATEERIAMLITTGEDASG